MSNVTIFLITLLIVYMGALKVVSYFAYKKSKTDTEDYFISGRDVGLLALIGTTAATVFSTGTVVAAPSEFYKKGTGYFWIFFTTTFPLLIMFFGMKFWKLGKVKRFVTPGDLLGDFYQSKKLKVIVGFLGVIAMIPYAAAQLVAVGKTFVALTDGLVSYEIGITIIFIAMGLYLFFGGSRAVVWTDMVQGFLLIILLAITGVLVVDWAGGWETMVNILYDKNKDNVEFNPSWKYFEILLNMISYFFLPYVWQRMYMSRSAAALAKVSIVIAFMFAALFFITWVIGSSTYSILPEGLVDGDGVMGSIFKDNAPYFGSVVIVAVFAAGMSTIDSQMLSAGSVVTHDFKHSFSGKDDKKDYMLGRNFTIVLLIGVFVWSLFLKDRSVYNLILLGTTMSVIFIPSVIGVFYWKRSSSAGAVCSHVSGVGIYLIKEFTPLGVYFPSMIGTVSYVFGASLIVFIVVSLLTDHKSLDLKRDEYKNLLKA